MRSEDDIDFVQDGVAMFDGKSTLQEQNDLLRSDIGRAVRLFSFIYLLCHYFLLGHHLHVCTVLDHCIDEWHDRP